MTNDILIFLGFYLFCGHLCLAMWRKFIHLIPNEDGEDDIDPHSTFAYIVVFVAGPAVCFVNMIGRLFFGDRE